MHGFVFRQSALWRLCLQKQADGNLQLLLGRKQPRKDCVGFTRLGFAMVGLSMYMLAKWPLDCLTVWSHASIHKGLCMDLSSANRHSGDSVFRNRLMLMGTCNCFLVAKSHTKTTLHHGGLKCVHAGPVATSLSDGLEPCQHTQGAVHGFVFRQLALWRLCLQKQADGNLQLLLGRKQPRKD